MPYIQKQKIVDTSKTYFGEHVAASGADMVCTTIIFSGLHNGTLEFYTYDGSNWQYLQTLATGSSWYRFGYVAMDGDIAAATFRKADDGTNNGVAIYQKSGGSWSPVASFTPNPGLTRMWSDVSVSGNTIATGSSEEDGTYTRQGVVRMYINFSGSWVLEQVITPPVPKVSGHFGESVCVNGDMLCVGETDNGPSGYGQVHVYYRYGGQWYYSSTINWPTVPAGWEFYAFGETVRISPDQQRIAVGDSCCSQCGNSFSIVPITDGHYDGYRVVLENTGFFPPDGYCLIGVHCESVWGGSLDAYFGFVAIPSNVWVENPYPTGTGHADSDIGFDVFGEKPLRQDSLNVFLNDLPILEGPNTFLPPFNGPASSVTPISADGYDGYRVILQDTGFLTPDGYYAVDVHCEAVDGGSVDADFGFTATALRVWLENEHPIDTGTITSEIGFDVLGQMPLRQRNLRVHLNSILALDGDTFIPPFNGPASSVAPITVGGYDGYRVILQDTELLIPDGYYLVHVYCTDTDGGFVDGYFGFTAIHERIWLENQHPQNDGGTDLSADMGFDVFGELALRPETLQVNLNGSPAFRWPDTFFYPFNGPMSSVGPITSDGYDGYRLFFDNAIVLEPGALYAVTVDVDDISDYHFSGQFEFFTENVIVSAETGPFEVTIDLVLSGPAQADQLQLCANYILSNNAYVREAELLDLVGDCASRVRLWTELLYGQESFSLRLAGILDCHGYPISRGTVVNIFHSPANIANYDGKVRTWRESEFVQADSERIYLAGTRGIDVLRKKNASDLTRWAQVFDGYGIHAMFVANYGGDYRFRDTVPPYLTNQHPAPGGAAATTDPVLFGVADITTAVEIPSVIVYVNNRLVFRGNTGGWTGGFTGHIGIGPKELSFKIVCPDGLPPNTTVPVRVIATDLLGNTLDSTYSFNVLSPPVHGGYGLIPLGTMPFGGA